MHAHLPLLHLLPLLLAAIFSVLFLCTVLGSRPVKQALLRWGYEGFDCALAVVSFWTAVLLSLPQTRALGVVATGFVLFAAVVFLLERRRWLFALAGMATMAVLTPALALAP